MEEISQPHHCSLTLQQLRFILSKHIYQRTGSATALYSRILSLVSHISMTGLARNHVPQSQQPPNRSPSSTPHLSTSEPNNQICLGCSSARRQCEIGFSLEEGKLFSGTCPWDVVLANDFLYTQYCTVYAFFHHPTFGSKYVPKAELQAGQASWTGRDISI